MGLNLIVGIFNLESLVNKYIDGDVRLNTVLCSFEMIYPAAMK